MPVLGCAIATYLSNLRGQYSVELPTALSDEMNDVVITCNAMTGAANRALLVTDDPVPQPNITAVPWAEKLKWRTDDDRIFVLARGGQEPDTSFRSVVRPFISNQFPGENGGECTTELLARLTVEELWRRHNFPSTGDSFDAFNRTFKWVADVLRWSFEEAGSTPSAHWSDQFLIHWADMMKYLDDTLGKLNGMPVPRHAWEIVRVAGLPVPSAIVESGNPFLNAPKELDHESYWARFARQWQEVTDKYLHTQGDVAVLLTALDAQVRGAGNTSPWRDLNWNIVPGLAPDVAAPVLGKAVFTGPPSPTLLSNQVPSYPIAPPGSWWGVTDEDLQQAISRLHQATKLEPSPSCTAFVSVLSGQPSVYLLETRSGIATQASTSKKWITQVSLSDLRVSYRARWENLTISPIQPSTGNESDAWIKPEDVALEVSPRQSEFDVVYKQVSTEAGERLAVQFDAVIHYTAARDAAINTVKGTWNPLRTLRLKAKVSYYLNGSWTPPRPIDSAMTVLIPSPFSPTLIVAKDSKVISIPGKEDSFTTTLNGGPNIFPPKIPAKDLLKRS